MGPYTELTFVVPKIKKNFTERRKGLKRSLHNSYGENLR